MKSQLNVIRKTVAERFSVPTVPDGALRSAIISKLMSESAWQTEDAVSTAVDNIYLPIFEYITCAMRITTPCKAPFFVGISAPQGAGKTTLTSALQYMFSLHDKRCEILSLDDFYLTANEQANVAERHVSNPLLKYRGNAGTHDMSLLQRTLQKLQTVSARTPVCRIPRYDKSLNEGRGDRAPIEEWSVVNEVPDVVLLEGWMLGFKALRVEEVAILSDDMREVNDYLYGYKEFHCLMDAWLVINAERIEYVYRWRQEAEAKMSKNGKPSLNEEQIRDFVVRFMPAYDAYLPVLRQHGPERMSVMDDRLERFAYPVLQVTIGADRVPIAASTI